MRIKRLVAGALLALAALQPLAWADDLPTGSWNETDASNNANPPNGWPAGMLPNAVEPAARSNMGAIKRFYDAINPTVSTSGSAGAYVITTANTSYPTSYSQGQTFCAKANFTSLGNDTLAINSLSALPIYKPSSSGPAKIAAGDLQSAAMFCAAYDAALNASAGGFQLVSPIPFALPANTVSGPGSSTSGDFPSFNGAGGTVLQDSGVGAANVAQGPASAVSGDLPSFNGTGGKSLQDSGVAAANIAQGPGSAVSGNLPSFNGTGGKSLQDSGVAALNVAHGPGSSTSGDLAAWNGSGGTTLKDLSLSAALDAAFSSSQGTILYRGSGGWSALAPGTSGYFLQTQGASANPQWAAAATFTAKYTSSPTAIPSASSTTSFTHGLGGVPFGVEFILQNVNSELGYSPGDQVMIPVGITQEVTAVIGLGALITSTTVVVQGAGGTIFIPTKAGVTASQITNANWTLIVEAWR